MGTRATVGLVIGLAACNGDATPVPGAGMDLAPAMAVDPVSGVSGSWSCDAKMAGRGFCVDYSWSGGEYAPRLLVADCRRAGARVIAACERSGSVGGCQQTATMGQATLIATVWWWGETVAHVMQYCAANGQTFVAP